MRRALVIAALLLLSLPARADDMPSLRADPGLVKAEAQLADEKYEQALDTLRLVLERRPLDADAHTDSAYAWMKLGEAEKAALSLDRALATDAVHIGANALRADIYISAGDIPRAREQLSALRLACGGSDCPDLDRLQSRINAARGKKD
jgi:Flp pilus assembly protein TadD